MKTMTQLLLFAVAAVLVPVSAHGQASDQPGLGVSEIRVALFSAQRAFAESSEGKTGLATLTALQEKRTREIEERRKSLDDQERVFKESASLLSEDARNVRLKELDRFRIDTQRLVEDAQAEFLGVQRGIESAFLAKLVPALDQVAQSLKLDVVLNADSDTIAWASPRVDITAQVAQQLARSSTDALPPR